jgi:hypothetical protein
LIRKSDSYCPRSGRAARRESEFTAKDNGQLYLAMNDVFSALWDNAGEMKADIRVRYAKPAPAAPAN